jgi:hypothetical protein
VSLGRLFLDVAGQDQSDVIARFVVRWNGVAIFHDGSFTRVVTCESQIHSAVEHLQKVL